MISGYGEQSNEEILEQANPKVIQKYVTGNVSENKARCWNKIVKIARVINSERFDEFIKQKKEEFASNKMFIHRTKQSLREE